MRLTLAELAVHKVFARFDTNDDVTITVYNRTAETTEILTSDVCDEIGTTGIFEWSFADLDSQPGSLTQFVWSMDNTTTTQDGTVEAGGYPDVLDELITSLGGVLTLETPWIVGNLLAGGDVTIKICNSAGVEELLNDDTCTEFVSGFYRWSTSNMTTYPTSVGSYMWVMTDGDRYTWGLTTIGVPEEIDEAVADAVWEHAQAIILLGDVSSIVTLVTMLRKILGNRLDIDETNSKMIIYDDDGETPLYEWPLTDAQLNAIKLAIGPPVNRGSMVTL